MDAITSNAADVYEIETIAAHAQADDSDSDGSDSGETSESQSSDTGLTSTSRESRHGCLHSLFVSDPTEQSRQPYLSIDDEEGNGPDHLLTRMVTEVQLQARQRSAGSLSAEDNAHHNGTFANLSRNVSKVFGIGASDNGGPCSNFAFGLTEIAQSQPDEVAFSYCTGQTNKDGTQKRKNLTYKDLDEFSSMAAAALSSVGICDGCRTLFAPDLGLGRNAIILLYALFKCGAVVIIPPTANIKPDMSLTEKVAEVQKLLVALRDTVPQAWVGNMLTSFFRLLFRLGKSSITKVVVVRRDSFGQTMRERLEKGWSTKRSIARRCLLAYGARDRLFTAPCIRKISRYSLTALMEDAVDHDSDGELSNCFSISDRDWATCTACILYTTGSTGVAKPVVYTHTMLKTMVDTVLPQLGFGLHKCTKDIDYGQSGMFLCHPLRGITTVLDTTPPLLLNAPVRLKEVSITEATTMFLSPQTARVLTKYVREGSEANSNTVLWPSVRLIYIGGENISSEDLQTLKGMIRQDGQVLYAYGATEGFPLTYLDSEEIVTDCWPNGTLRGRGFCVGRPVGDTRLRVGGENGENALKVVGLRLDSTLLVGEIEASGSLVSPRYLFNEHSELKRKDPVDPDTIWHSTGDVGYVDGKGRLWLLGRLAHAVKLKNTQSSGGSEIQLLFPNQVEPLVNRVLGVTKSALVGLEDSKTDEKSYQRPVLIVEHSQATDSQGSKVQVSWPQLEARLKELCVGCAEASSNSQSQLSGPPSVLPVLRDFVLYRDSGGNAKQFPVDPRHQSKIERPQLATWVRKMVERGEYIVK